MYQIFDFLIDSNIPLPELPQIDSGKASLTFNLLSGDPTDDNGLEWFHHWRLQDGEITISCGKTNDGYLLRFPHLADFLIPNDQNLIHCYRWPDVTDDTIRHLLLDQVIPRVVGHQGQIVLHASAVRIDEYGVAFLGESGWGKSTIASSLAQAGYSLMTDDCLLLKLDAGRVIGVPGYAGSRLWADSFEAVVNGQGAVESVAHYSSKKRLILHDDDVKNSDVQMRAIFVLGSPDESTGQSDIVVEPLSGTQALMEPLKHSFHLDITDLQRVGEQFAAMGNVAKSGLSFYRLTYPRDHSMLPAVRNALRETVMQANC